LRLASRTQTLRWLVNNESAEHEDFAHESLDIYAALANRLGIWQFKWEIEDLSLRLLEPATYKRIANMLDERRVERQRFIEEAIARVKRELKKAGIKAQVIGRPKHIYSIWNKMQSKHLDFDAIYDVRALRIIVDSINDCYAALGVVHQLWSPIEGEFDDYIAQPKSNHYRSLHTALIVEDGRSLEVQIRTEEMNQYAELGVAAHWRYKESASVADASYDNKISLLRQLLTWRDEVADTSAWADQFKRAALNDTIYVLTPQGKVIDLPQGSTALDFAYRLHTNLGHRCRGARADGRMWPLNRPLLNGQTIEINAVREGGPSRDWLGSTQGYLKTSGARRKVQQWFTAQESVETIANGRTFISKVLQREGQTQTNLELLAKKLGFRNVDAMFTAAGHDEIGPRQLQVALHGDATAGTPVTEVITKRSRASKSPVLIVGVDKLMTQLGRCCKPAPPDVISGFVTRGRGVSIHRRECVNFRHLMQRNPERVIAAEWGNTGDGLYAIGMQIEAYDRKSLLRDISELLSREKINVTAVRSTSRKDGTVRMNFTVEISATAMLPRVLAIVAEISGVYAVKRV
jgi:GTP pyrophosphokinase